MQLPNQLLNQLMDLALQEARQAASEGEVPVGSIVAQDGNVIAQAHNEVEAQHDATCHAELLALRRASQKVGDWRLSNCLLVVTLEPCPMCISAIRLARIPTVCFGARDPRMGAAGSLFDLSQDTRLGASPRVIEGIKESECSALLKEFFAQLR